MSKEKLYALLKSSLQLTYVELKQLKGIELTQLLQASKEELIDTYGLSPDLAERLTDALELFRRMQDAKGGEV